jgi:DNA-directed RNA polymerase subunit RPC12/RpoP
MALIKIVYICLICGKEIIRRVKENEKILSGYVICECGNKIIYFKINL